MLKQLKRLFAGSPRGGIGMPPYAGFGWWWGRGKHEDLGPVSVAQLLQSSAVVACAQLISNSLSAAPWSVVQRLPSGGLRQVSTSDATASLATLTFDDRVAALFGALTSGNGFWSLRPDRSMVALDTVRTFAFIDQKGAVWLRQGDEAFIAYSNVAHIRWASTPGFVMGWNPALIPVHSIKADLAIARMAGGMASNAATPQGLLTYPGVLSDDAALNIRKAWNDINAGDQQGSVAILEEGLTYQQLKPPSAVDAQMTQALEWSAGDICRLYAVPESCLGLTKNTNRATAAEENRAFYSRCLKPWSARITDVMNRLLLSEAERNAGLSVEVDLSELQLGSGEARGTYLRTLVLSGVLTANEARNSIGFEDLPDGDKLLRPLNVAPADEIGAHENAAT